MNIGILGCGWLGTRLALTLINDKHNVLTTNTSEIKADKLRALGCKASVVNFEEDQVDSLIIDEFKALDLIVISVKVSRAAQYDLQNRVFQNVTKFLKGYKGKLILFSTTGIYPQENRLIREETFTNDQLHPKIFNAENIIRTHFPQVNVLRLAGLLGDDRKMTNWIKDFNQIKDPQNPVNHVHYLDIIQIILRLMRMDVSGQIFNVVAPEHPTKAQVFFGKIDIESRLENHRIIDGSKLEKSLDFQYNYPDPIQF